MHTHADEQMMVMQMILMRWLGSEGIVPDGVACLELVLNVED